MLLAFSLLFIMASASEPGVLTLQGEGTLTVPFDKVKVRVQITCKSQGVNTATVAQTQNQETAKDFMVALEDELGIGKKNLKMEHIDLHPIREYKDHKSYVIGYSASIQLVIDISTEDKKLVPQIYALSSRFEVENTEMNVYGAQAYVSDKKHKEHFAELFKLSMENARWKAEMYAEGAGRKLGAVMQMSDKPISVQTIHHQQPRHNRMMAKRGGGPEMAMAYGAKAGGMDEMEMPLGEGQILKQFINLQYELL